MTKGEELKFLRKDRKVSQEELADRLGVKKGHISMWERDKCLPNKENSEKLNDWAGYIMFDDGLPKVSHKVASLLTVAKDPNNPIPVTELISLVNRVSTEEDNQQDILKAISLGRWRVKYV